MRFASSAAVARAVDALYPALRDPARLLDAVANSAGADPPVVAGHIGSLRTRYRLQVTVVDSDPAARSVRYRLRAREQQGLGDIDGLVVAQVLPGYGGDRGDRSVLSVRADLDIRGQVARFGGDALRAAVDEATRHVAAALAQRGGDEVPAGSVTAAAAAHRTDTGTSGRTSLPAPRRRGLGVAVAAGLGIVLAARVFRRRRAGGGRGVRGS